MKITIISTKGKKRSIVETTSTTWGELQKDLSTAKVDTSNMKAIIGQTQVTLESSKAILPNFDFTLFLTPIKVKSGNDVQNLSRLELYDLIKAFRFNNPGKKDVFNKYSNQSTEVLRALVTENIFNSKPSVKKVVNTETADVEDEMSLIKKHIQLLEDKIEENKTIIEETPKTSIELDKDEIIKEYLLKIENNEIETLMNQYYEIEKNL